MLNPLGQRTVAVQTTGSRTLDNKSPISDASVRKRWALISDLTNHITELMINIQRNSSPDHKNSMKYFVTSAVVSKFVSIELMANFETKTILESMDY